MNNADDLQSRSFDSRRRNDLDKHVDPWVDLARRHCDQLCPVSHQVVDWTAHDLRTPAHYSSDFW